MAANALLLAGPCQCISSTPKVRSEVLAFDIYTMFHNIFHGDDRFPFRSANYH